MVNYVYLIPLLPLVSFAANIFFGRRLKEKSALVSVGAIAASFVLSLTAFSQVLRGNTIETSFAWLSFAGKLFNFGVVVDPLASVMLLIVTGVGMLIQIYSIGYMRGDPRYPRFFAYMSLFSFSMLGLVLADNFAFIYIFWELVGLCSYFLISFWFEKPAAARARLHAVITKHTPHLRFFIGIL